MKCPKCKIGDLNFYAFSIVPDCGVNCNNCDFSITTEVSWDGDNVKEHDKKCYDYLVNLINKEHETILH